MDTAKEERPTDNAHRERRKKNPKFRLTRPFLREVPGGRKVLMKRSPEALSDIPDSRLAARYAAARDEDAFAELVRRHGSMVYRVCRAMAGDLDAEDCSQAVFICLARKAASLKRTQSLAAWLYGVARRVAARALRDRANLARRERGAGAMHASSESTATDAHEQTPEMSEVYAQLDTLSALQRQAIVLRYLEGHGEKEAAALAGCTRVALRRRTADGVAKLRARLAKRGAAVGAAALLLMFESEASGGVPSHLLASMRAASHAAEATATAGSVSSAASSLAERTLRTMLVSKSAPVVAGVVASFAIALLAIFALRIGGDPVAPALPAPLPKEKEPASPAAPPTAERAPQPKETNVHTAQPSPKWGRPILISLGARGRAFPVDFLVEDGVGRLLLSADRGLPTPLPVIARIEGRGSKAVLSYGESGPRGPGSLVETDAVHVVGDIRSFKGPQSGQALPYACLRPDGSKSHARAVMPGEGQMRYVASRLLSSGGRLVLLATGQTHIDDPRMAPEQIPMTVNGLTSTMTMTRAVAVADMFAAVSTDHGATWARPVSIEQKIRPDGPYSFYRPCSFMSGDRVGWFYMKHDPRDPAALETDTLRSLRAARLMLASSGDGAGSWTTRELSEIHELSGGETETAIPLACAESGKDLYLLLAAVVSGHAPLGNARDSVVQYFVAASGDLGETWRSCTAISAPVESSESCSMSAHVAATGSTVAVSYAVGARAFKAHVLRSEDGGANWADLHAFDEFALSGLTRLAFDATHGDLYAAALVMKDPRQGRDIAVRVFGSGVEGADADASALSIGASEKESQPDTF
jgi:RNA polymerase sigma factor (sigma-70 family)